MNTSSLEPQILAYLNDQMPPGERAAFEALLRSDQTARDTYIRFCVKGEGAAILAQEDPIRLYAAALRERTGPLPEPKMTWLDHLRMAWYARPLRTGALALMAPLLCAVLGLFAWANTGGVAQASEVAARHFMEPPHAGIAGAPQPEAAMTQKQVFEKAARTYWADQPAAAADNLRALAAQHTPFSFADYYLAHSLLKNRQWPAAKAAFEQCLQPQHTAYIRDLEDTRDLAPLRLNLLLARFGETGRYDGIRADLEGLISGLPATSTVRKTAESFRSEMENPLRRFNLR